MKRMKYNINRKRFDLYINALKCEPMVGVITILLTNCSKKENNTKIMYILCLNIIFS